jgi:hypothetical protein
MASLRFIKELSLPSNLLTGVLPSQLFTLPRLLTLNLAYNSFNFTSFPDSLGLRLAPLRELNLSGIDTLVGSMPFSLCGFESLTSLDLGSKPHNLSCVQPCLVTAAAAARRTRNFPISIVLVTPIALKKLWLDVLPVTPPMVFSGLAWPKPALVSSIQRSLKI